MQLRDGMKKKRITLYVSWRRNTNVSDLKRILKYFSRCVALKGDYVGSLFCKLFGLSRTLAIARRLLSCYMIDVIFTLKYCPFLFLVTLLLYFSSCIFFLTTVSH